MISGRFFPRNLRKGFILLSFYLICVSCSNTKDTFINRTFHNLSAHYNGYYNAGLKIEDALDKLAAGHVDHYDRTLSVFQYGDLSKAKSVYPQLDDAMKRTATVIDRHTMRDKRGNEKPDSEKWIDDNWIVYGKAQFFRHDYFEAIETFKYVETTYKKEPGRHLASMWLAKTYLELTQLKEAEDKLDYLRNQSDFPRKNLWELEATRADFYLQTKNNDKAIEHLTKAAALVKKRESKIRFRFILAQLYQQKGEFKRAFDLYSKVIKMNPKYEMAFSARLNRARCVDSGTGSAEVRKELHKMEKDIKNKDFLDQIYYALAGLSKNEGKEEEQIEYLNKSVRSSTNNANQKALSYLELGKIAYSKPDYRLAQVYYDSTITSLTNDYPGYTDILTRRNSLTKLIKNIRTIELEDSLQKLSALSKAEQETIINNLIETERKAKEEEQIEQQSNQIFDPSSQQDINQFNKAGGSNWYFYNPQAISFGFNEFAKKFGTRKLEDNWRRSNKQSVIANPDELEPDETDSLITDEKEIKDPVAAAEKKRQDMLKTIPSGQEAIDKSKNKIIEAYYNNGMIYREQLNDFNASVATFEELMRRFPGNKFEVQVYYQLYRTYALMNDGVNSEKYKNIILSRFSDTEYAEIIRNPNYFDDKAKRKSTLELFYEETYRKFLNGEYAAVIQRKGEADAQFPKNPLTPKFDLLKTLSIGHLQPLAAFEASLNDIIRNYSEDEVKDRATEILDFLRTRGGQSSTTPPPVPVDSLLNAGRSFSYFPDTTHYVVIIFQNIGGPLDANILKSRLSDFNSANFSAKTLNIQDILFDHRDKIVIIRSFANKAEALAYNSILYDNDAVYGNINPDAYKEFVISENNLPELLKQKKTDEYDDFYRSFYK
jgi:tetratricopeptide (TPR) repeat protein